MLTADDQFIRHPAPFDPAFRAEDPAPMFRRTFEVSAGLLEATLSLCALGSGEVFFNGRRLTEDRFTTPWSDYRKTLWVTEYDVTRLLHEGTNVAAAALGNGFFNESLHTPWDFDQAPWRDSPKMAFRLVLRYPDRVEYVLSDESWRTNRSLSPWRFNELRYGEVYDARFDTDWADPGYDDSSWDNAVFAESPGGVFRKCSVPPIREKAIYECVKMWRSDAGNWVFDFGQNLSGYVRLSIPAGAQPCGTRITLTYAEQLNPDGSRRDNGLDHFYRDGKTATSTIVCDGEALVWKPSFSYYGFRYVIAEGFVTPPAAGDMVSVFVHQDVAVTGHFSCSDTTLNNIFNMGRFSVFSNLFWVPTDCPTREKLGWCNDAQASVEQMVQNYDMTAFYDRWMQDIADAQTEDGNMPGIVPTWGWGFDKWAGPVSTGVFFEIPQRIYQYTGSDALLIRAYPYMVRHIEWLDKQRDEKTGLVCTGLPDWAGPFAGDKITTPPDFISSAVAVKMARIAVLAAQHACDKEGEAKLTAWRDALIARLNEVYIKDGKLTVPTQSAIAMTIALGLTDNTAPLKEQLRAAMEQYGGHLHVGMVGMQYLLKALDLCGMQEAAYRVLTAEGFPGYAGWFADGATTLFEYWQNNASCNHHMYSCVIAWFRNTVLGIRTDEKVFTEHVITIEPSFLRELTHAEGTYDTAFGKIAVSWRREGTDVLVTLHIPAGMTARLICPGGEQTLSGGDHAVLCPAV